MGFLGDPEKSAVEAYVSTLEKHAWFIQEFLTMTPKPTSSASPTPEPAPPATPVPMSGFVLPAVSPSQGFDCLILSDASGRTSLLQACAQDAPLDPGENLYRVQYTPAGIAIYLVRSHSESCNEKSSSTVTGSKGNTHE